MDFATDEQGPAQADARLGILAMRDRIQLMLDHLRPAVRPDADSQRVFESQLRLAKTEGFTAKEIENYQLVHLRNLVRFAVRNVPFWRSSIAAASIEQASTLAEALSAPP